MKSHGTDERKIAHVFARAFALTCQHATPNASFAPPPSSHVRISFLTGAVLSRLTPRRIWIHEVIFHIKNIFAIQFRRACISN